MSQENLIDSTTGLYSHGVSLVDAAGTAIFQPDGLQQVFTYGGPAGAVDTITAGPDASSNSYRQTFTYTGSNLTTISAWVKL